MTVASTAPRFTSAAAAVTATFVALGPAVAREAIAKPAQIEARGFEALDELWTHDAAREQTRQEVAPLGPVRVTATATAATA